MFVSMIGPAIVSVLRARSTRAKKPLDGLTADRYSPTTTTENFPMNPTTTITKRVSPSGYRELMKSRLVTGGLLKTSAVLLSDNGEWNAGGETIFGRVAVVGLERDSILVSFEGAPEIARTYDENGDLLVSIW
jgi:hypothetical protein